MIGLQKIGMAVIILNIFFSRGWGWLLVKHRDLNFVCVEFIEVWLCDEFIILVTGRKQH